MPRVVGRLSTSIPEKPLPVENTLSGSTGAFLYKNAKFLPVSENRAFFTKLLPNSVLGKV